MIHVLRVIWDVELDSDTYFQIWPKLKLKKIKFVKLNEEIVQFCLRIPKLSFTLTYDSWKCQKLRFKK